MLKQQLDKLCEEIAVFKQEVFVILAAVFVIALLGVVLGVPLL